MCCRQIQKYSMKAIARLILLTLLVMVAGTVKADNFSFDPTVKFRIESVRASGSAVALGVNHGVNSPVCVATSNVDEADCYWYIREYKPGMYAIRNARTGQYLAFDNVRSDNPIRRYMTLANSVGSDSVLWTIDVYNDAYYFRSVVNESYCFNLRSGSWVLGTYAEGGIPTADNELFNLCKEDGSLYDPVADANMVCGKNADGYYWCKGTLDMPVAFSRGESNPIYYQIKNVRSGQYVSPEAALGQSTTEPTTRFYFIEAQDGVQIMVEGGKYVSGELPIVSATTDSDVRVRTGSPDTDDEVWGLTYNALEANPGYSVGVVACGRNAADNGKWQSGMKYWNDFSGKGICYYRVDEGSTFMFYSKDSRHRDYLASRGYVIPGETLPGDGSAEPDPVDPDPIDPDDPEIDIELEPLSGGLTHVYRADGKIDVIPRMYIENIRQDADSVVVTTKDGGPVYGYRSYEVDSLSTAVPANLPVFNSFKFNNKYNPHLVTDAMGLFYGDSLITLNPVCIGKRLRPSFKVDDDVEVFIGRTLQVSKQSRTRYDNDVVYTLARHGHTILRRTVDNDYVTCPYGRETVVRVTFATDNSTGQYNVPVIHITTENFTEITSKDYYLNATIRIDGAGVFADMPETSMQIKGRGNSSWGEAKKPYHMKFPVAVKALGLTKGKHWNLIANAQSGSMTTNAVAMKIAQLVETAGYNHEIPVELYINNIYRGSYNLTEKVGFSNNSIDLLDETYATMLELDSYYDETYRFRTDNYYLPVNVKEPDLSEGTSPLTLSEIQQNFNKVTDALARGEDISKYVDLDYLARFLFVNELVYNSEIMHPKSLFCYNENIRNAESKYIFGPVWDFDWSYGYEHANDYFTYTPTVDFWTNVNMSGARWVRDMRNCGEEFNKVYYNLWHKFMTDGSLNELLEFCDDYYEFASPSFVHNSVKWNDGSIFRYSNITGNAKSWLKRRAEYIYDYMSNTLGYADMGYIEKPTVLRGDVNEDGAVTTADLVCVLNHILGLPNETFNYDRADLDANDMITIGDALAVRNLIGSGAAGSRSFYSLPEAEAAVSAGVADNTPTGICVPLNLSVADGDYCGLQFDLTVPAGMVVEDLDLSKSIPDFDYKVMELAANGSADKATDRYRVVIYSAANHTIPGGASVIELQLGWGNMESGSKMQNVFIDNVMFVTSLGEDERSVASAAPFCKDELSGISDIVSTMRQNGNELSFDSSESGVLAVYGIDGRRYRLYDVKPGLNTLTLPKGIFIINRQKVVIR